VIKPDDQLYEETVECPHCQAAVSVLLLRSCNTFGATFYTDGSVAGDVYDDTCLLNICPCCGEYFWLEDAKPRTGDGERAGAATPCPERSS
jgi:hypothetical protein